MVSDKEYYDLRADLEDGHYKSYFARSMAVNAQYRENKAQCLAIDKSVGNVICYNKQNADGYEVIGDTLQESASSTTHDAARLEKDLRNQNFNDSVTNGNDSNYCNTSSSNSSASSTGCHHLSSLCSNQRIQESPVENFYLQSQINTLQWQLKETESSREMYRTVMRQVVTFLERAHRSLALQGTRSSQVKISRPQSEYFTCNSSMPHLDTPTEAPWFRRKKQEYTLDEIPPEKLAQEAYSLLRTAESLLSTHEPDLAHIAASKTDEDLNFLSQLAKEFPSQPDPKTPQRATSFSLRPKLLTPEKDRESDSAMSLGFNRKLSLQLSDTNRRNSLLRDVTKLNRSHDLSRLSFISNCETSSNAAIKDPAVKPLKYENASSPPVSSVGSAEDESGFSSMNSFQEVGLPHVDITLIDKPRLISDDNFKQFADDLKLWETPNVKHNRWSSTPVVDTTVLQEKAPVLWV